MTDFVMGLFGKDAKADPKEQVRDWNRKMRQEMRQIDRQINQIRREELKVTKQIKDAAKKGDKDVCKILAKEVLRARKAQTKLHVTKAQINSVCMHMQHQLSTIRMAGSIQASTEVMKSMQSLVKMPEVAATMRALSKEMTKAGIMEEMIDDTFEAMDPEEMEEEAAEEVDKVLAEILSDKMVAAPSVPAGSMSVAEATADSDEEVAEDLGDMKARLEALRTD